MMVGMYLLGDEDCGVGLHCSTCWDGGRPLAYYESNPGTTYPDRVVPTFHEMDGLMAAATEHAAGHQPRPSHK